MAEHRFDALIRQTMATRLSRWNALRALAAGAGAALVGTQRPGETVAAAAKKKKQICLCTKDTVRSCRQTRVRKRRLRKVLNKFPCSYRGECHGFNPCSPLPTSESAG